MVHLQSFLISPVLINFVSRWVFCVRASLMILKTGSGGAIRRHVFELEHGVCQLCRLDCHKLYISLSALSSVDDRRKILMNTSFKDFDPKRSVHEVLRGCRRTNLPHVFCLVLRISVILSKPKEGMLWQADHINPVSLGGGECDLTNFRTLCTPCHEVETAQLLAGA